MNKPIIIAICILVAALVALFRFFAPDSMPPVTAPLSSPEMIDELNEAALVSATESEVEKVEDEPAPPAGIRIVRQQQAEDISLSAPPLSEPERIAPTPRPIPPPEPLGINPDTELTRIENDLIRLEQRRQELHEQLVANPTYAETVAWYEAQERDIFRTLDPEIDSRFVEMDRILDAMDALGPREELSPDDHAEYRQLFERRYQIQRYLAMLREQTREDEVLLAAQAARDGVLNGIIAEIAPNLPLLDAERERLLIEHAEKSNYRSGLIGD